MRFPLDDDPTDTPDEKPPWHDGSPPSPEPFPPDFVLFIVVGLEKVLFAELRLDVAVLGLTVSYGALGLRPHPLEQSQTDRNGRELARPPEERTRMEPTGPA